MIHKVLVVAAFAAALLPGAAQATSFATKMSLKHLVAQSDLVFSGTVQSLASEQDDGGNIWTLYTFGSVEPIVGTIEGDTFALRCMGGEIGGVGQMVHGIPLLRQGDEAIVFFRARNEVCQISGWAAGALYVTQHAGARALVTDDGMLVIGADASGFKTGRRHSTWTRKNGTPPEAEAATGTAAAAPVDAIKRAIADVARAMNKRTTRAVPTASVKGRVDALTVGVAP